MKEVVIITPKVYKDSRGFFFESYNTREFQKVTNLQKTFVQDNHSKSSKNVLRGLHFQVKKPQGKLVRVLSGEIFDVAVDLRKKSPTYGKWVGVELSAENHKQLWIPAGFAHGFLALSPTAEFLYKTTDYYHPQSEACLFWNDPSVGIQWPLPAGMTPNMNAKDQHGLAWDVAPKF